MQRGPNGEADADGDLTGELMDGAEKIDMERTLREIVSGSVRSRESMDRHTSLGVGGIADFFVEPAHTRELERLVAFLSGRNVPFFPLGNGTNLIVRDGGYRGIVISLKNLQHMEIRHDSPENPSMYAEAGVPLARIVEAALRESLTGIEFCAGIPGTLGGALRMNAGAWGGAMNDIVTSLFLVTPRGTVGEWEAKRLSFSYRNLDIPENSIITAALLSLVLGDSGKIRNRINENMARRRQRHPLSLRSAGSIFKNPSSAPAGRIIEEAGLKGARVGDAVVSELHGNFIVNDGKATAGDVLTLIDRLRDRVKELTGLELEREVIVIGEEP